MGHNEEFYLANCFLALLKTARLFQRIIVKCCTVFVTPAPPQLFDSLFFADQWTVLMASITASAKEDQIASCVDLLLSRKADPNVADR